MSDLVQQLIRLTGLSKSDFDQILVTAPRRYKSYKIPKRTGGEREIAQPAREVKLLQRALMEVLLNDLPVHRSAMAYRKGISIRDNAAKHCGNTPILKMDFQNFFPSIQAKDWENYCNRTGIIAGYDIAVTTLILFRLKSREIIPKLTIGAPSSPVVSNVLMWDFDERIEAEASQRGIKYSRYADDLTFSGQRIGMLSDMVGVVRKAVRQMRSPKLRVNKDKTAFITTAHRRTVTGVTLTNDGTLSAGRNRKRLIHAKVHRALNGALSSEELRFLAGELAFINVIEPKFLEKLADKYGAQTIERIKKQPQS